MQLAATMQRPTHRKKSAYYLLLDDALEYCELFHNLEMRENVHPRNIWGRFTYGCRDGHQSGTIPLSCS